MTQPQQRDCRFEVALSLPGEVSDRVEEIAKLLQNRLGEGTVFLLSVPPASWRLRTWISSWRGSTASSQGSLYFFCKDYSQKSWCGLEWRIRRACC